MMHHSVCNATAFVAAAMWCTVDCPPCPAPPRPALPPPLRSPRPAPPPAPSSQDDTLDVTTCKVMRQEAPEMVLAVRKVVKEGQVQVRTRERGGAGQEGEERGIDAGGEGEPFRWGMCRRPLGMTRVLIEITQMATLSICPHAGPGVRRRVVGAAWAGAGQQAGCRDAHQPGEAVRGRSRPGSHAVHACCSCMLFMHAVHACCSYG